MQYSEITQSGRLKQTNETHEIYSGKPRVVSYIKVIQNKFLKWNVDLALAVHLDFKSHTGATLTMVKVSIVYMS